MSSWINQSRPVFLIACSNGGVQCFLRHPVGLLKMYNPLRHGAHLFQGTLIWCNSATPWKSAYGHSPLPPINLLHFSMQKYIFFGELGISKSRPIFSSHHPVHGSVSVQGQCLIAATSFPFYTHFELRIFHLVHSSTQ
jgi:hypothetical protein